MTLSHGDLGPDTDSSVDPGVSSEVDTLTPAGELTNPPPRSLCWLYVLGGATGLLAAFALTIEKIDKLANPAYVPSCDLNPVVSCGTVMNSAQGAVFGFPNPLIGIAAFAVVICAGAALLGGFTAPRWFWVGMQVGTTLGVAFVHWLIFQTLYEIHALCPWCMVVWTVTIPIFWYTTRHNLHHGHLRIGSPARARVDASAAVLVRFHSLVLVLWYLLIVVLILQEFWSFWLTRV